MPTIRFRPRLLLVPCLFLFIGACGGGGGGGNGPPPPATDHSPPPAPAAPQPPPTVSPESPETSVHIRVFEHYLALPREVLLANVPDDAALEVEYSGTGVLSANLSGFTLTIQPPSQRYTGTYTGEVLVHMCAPPGCAEGEALAGSPLRVQVTTQVVPPEEALSIEPRALYYEREFAEKSVPPAQHLYLTPPEQGEWDWRVSVEYPTELAAKFVEFPAWVDGHGAGNVLIPLKNEVADYSRGTRTATLRVGVRAAGKTWIWQFIPVTLEVHREFDVYPRTPEWTISPASTPAQAQPTITVISRAEHLAQYENIEWRIDPAEAVLPPFLEFTRTEGDTKTDNTVQLRFIDGAVEEMEVGTYEVNFIVWPTNLPPGYGQGRTVRGEVTVDLPRIDYVSPPWTPAGVAEEVIVRGSNLGAIGNAQLLIGDHPAYDVQLVNATELRVLPPPLDEAGAYTIRVDNELDFTRSQAELWVGAPHVFESVRLNLPGAKTRILYDPAQRAVFVVDTEGGRVVRVRTDGAQWGDIDQVAIPGIRHAALSPDLQYLLALTGDELFRIDATTLEAEMLLALPEGGWGDPWAFIEFTNDGRALTNRSHHYDPISQTMVSNQFSMPHARFPAPTLDRSRVYIGGPYISNPAGAGGVPVLSIYEPQLYFADTTTGTQWEAQSTGVSAHVFSLATDRTGSRIALVRRQDHWDNRWGEVYDNQFVKLGELPPEAAHVAVSPDGRYVYTWGGNEVNRYDVAGAAVIRDGDPLPVSSHAETGAMTLTPDGATLVLADEAGLEFVRTDSWPWD